jgi:iron-sulfur cluster assembly protein
MAIQLTDSAHRRVSTFLEKDGGAALRLGVRRTGCSGWAYVVDLTDEIDDEDTVFENRGVTIVVDPKSLPLVDGTRIDFVAEGLNRTFKFSNPNVTDECGCGESFSVTGVAVGM